MSIANRINRVMHLKATRATDAVRLRLTASYGVRARASDAALHASQNGVQREIPAGAAQALAFEHGRGHVVVFGEAAMITAQVAEGIPFGVQLRDCDNLAFARNVLRWLSSRQGVQSVRTAQ